MTIMIGKTLILTIALLVSAAAVPASASTTVFGDKIEGLAAAITGNFTTPEPYKANSAVAPGLPIDYSLQFAATKAKVAPAPRG